MNTGYDLTVSELQATTELYGRAPRPHFKLKLERISIRYDLQCIQGFGNERQSQITLLQTKLKEVQPKIDRLQDYEVKIDQLSKMQTLW
jgi:hypothetical protein